MMVVMMVTVLMPGMEGWIYLVRSVESWIEVADGPLPLAVQDG